MSEPANFAALPWRERKTTPHEVPLNEVEAIGYVCGRCGEPVDLDSDWAWHREAKLNPSDDYADEGVTPTSEPLPSKEPRA